MLSEADHNVAETLIAVEPRWNAMRTAAAFRRGLRRWLREQPETRHAC